MRNVFLWAFRAFVFTIPLYPAVSVKLLLVTFFLSFFGDRTEIRLGQALAKSWEVVLYFVVLALGVLYSENWAGGLSVLETSFGLLALVFIFGRGSHKSFELEVKILLYALFLGLLTACVICLVTASYNFGARGDLNSFFHYELTDVINSHPTYLAYYLISSITYGIYLMYNEPGQKVNLLFGMMVIFFFMMMLLTGGRTAFVSLLLVLSFFILKYLLDTSTRTKRFTISIVCVMIIGLFGFHSMSYLDGSIEFKNDYWERLVLWESAIDANPSPIFGVGTGDYKDALNEYYQSHNMSAFARESFNSHNQFIQLYFSNGITGLLAIVFLIGRPLYLSFRNQNALGILLIFPFLIYGVTEVFLGRYQGVVFFGFLHQIVISQYYALKQPLSLKEV